MAMYEITAAMRPYRRYLLLSELLEPGHGWDYRWFGNITTNVTAAGSTSLDVGGYIIDGCTAAAAAAAAATGPCHAVGAGLPQLAQLVVQAHTRLAGWLLD
jgi:hypothetical protein